jgi:hypothetical protein
MFQKSTLLVSAKYSLIAYIYINILKFTFRYTITAEETMIKLLILLTTFVLLIAQNGPGGIGSSATNVLWLKANAGLTVNGSSQVVTWADQSGNSNNGSPETGRTPVASSSQNSQQSLTWTNDAIHVTNSAGLNLSGAYTIFAVFNGSVVSTAADALYYKRNGTGNDQGLYFQGNRLRIKNNTYERQTATGAFVNNTWYVVSLVHTGSGNYVLYRNGQSVTVNTASFTDLAAPTNQNLSIGARISGNRFSGQLPEMIMYNNSLTNAQRIIVENYLANKYNITITNDYYAHQANHQFDLAGLGRDGSSNTNLTANSTLFNLNIGSIGTADSYLVFGHNGADTAWTSSEFYTDGSNNTYKKINREWRLDRNNSALASPNLEFNVSQLATQSLSPNMSYHLLIDSDGNFAAGANTQALSLQSGSIYGANAVSVADDSYLTIAIQTTEPVDQATGLNFSSVANTSMTVSYTAAISSPESYIVLRQAASAPIDVPLDGIDYSAGNIIGLSTVAYVGSSTNFSDSGLNSGTVYHYAVYTYNGSGTFKNYNINSPLIGNQATSSSAMVYSSSTSTQNTNIVVPGSTEETIIGIEVVVSGDQSPLTISQMFLNTTGTTSSADIQNAKLWYTGTTNPFEGREFSKMKSKVSSTRPNMNFSIQNDIKYNYHIDEFISIYSNNIKTRSKGPSGSTQFASTVASPSGVMTFTGSQTLSQGTNYFWLTYDIVPSATVTNVVDAQFDSLVISGTNYVPSLSAPTGSRTIQNYASSQSTNFNYEHITNVTFSNISNSSVGSFYTDYSSLSPAVVYRNNSYDLDVTIKVDEFEYLNAWIDWNNDGDFADADESYVLATNTSSTGPHTVSISVPVTANIGETRMRVTLKYGAAATATETFTFGEVEDYKLDIRQTVNMTYVSSTTSQNTNYIGRNTTNQQIIGLQVVTSGIDNPLALSQINLNTTGTSSTSDISNAKIFFTGTSPDFATGTQFGSTLASPTGSFAVNGSASLSSGTNYFWLTYDIPSGATLNNVVDAQLSSFVVNSVTRTPSTTAPVGSREIRRVYNISTTTVTDNDGILYDDGGADNNYGASTDFTFTISPTSADYVTIQFNKFRYENQVSAANSDSIYVYDGPTTASPQITGSPFTGTTLPNAGDLITSSGASITIRQTSTANTFEAGFELEFIGYQNNSMAYSSSTVTQNTNVVGIGFTNQQIVGIEVITTGNQSAINLTALAANLNGTDPSYIGNAQLFYTGASSTFDTIAQLGSTVTNPSSTFNFNGTQALVTGTNYFWLTYDISATAPSEQTIDAAVTQITVGGSSYAPTVTSPSGNRTTKIIEGFEASFPPTNWTTALTSGATNWSQSTSISYNGSNSAEAARAQATRYLISPQVRPTSSDNTLRLWVRKHAAAGSNEGSLYIRISTNTNATGDFSTTVTQYLVNSFTTNWEEKVIDLSAYNNQAVYIAFIHENATGSDGGCFIDDIALPAEIEDITYTDISIYDLIIADNQDNVEVLRFVSNSQSAYTLNSIQLTNTASGVIDEVAALRLYKKRGATTSLVSTISNPSVSTTFSSLSESIESNDTLFVEADFDDFDYSNAYNFVVSSLSHITNGSSQTVTNVNFPLSSRTLTYTFFYTITPNNASPPPSFSNNSRSWMGDISFTEFGSANPVNIDVNSITVQNRLASGVSGTVSALDIDSVYIYYGMDLSPDLNTEPTAKADWIDDGNGGYAIIAFSPPVAASGFGIRFHIVYKMSSSITQTNKIGLRISNVDMENPASPYSPETDFSTDISLPVTISNFDAKDSEDAVKISLITASEPDLSILRIVREEIENGDKIIISEFETSGSVSHGKEYQIIDGTAEFNVGYKYIVYELAANGSLIEQASFNYQRKSPDNFLISAAYPNPFNPITTIKITLSEKSDINIRIYSVLGQLIKETRLHNVELGYKEIKWDATNNFGGKVASGMYFIQINVNSISSERAFQKIQKLVLLK